jgi:hypothetical protein
MKHFFALGLAMFVTACGCNDASSQPASPVQQKLDAAALLVDNRSVGIAKILYSPPRESPSRITLDSLVAGAPYALQLSSSAVQEHSRGLGNALRKTHPSHTNWSGGVNLAVVLYNQSGDEILRAGFEESDCKGYVGSEPVQATCDLLNWGKSLLSSSTKRE